MGEVNVLDGNVTAVTSARSGGWQPFATRHGCAPSTLHSCTSCKLPASPSVNRQRRGRGAERERDGETDRQTDRQRQTDKQADRERDRQTDRDRDRQTNRQTDRQTDRENSNLKTLFYKDCSLGSVKDLSNSERERGGGSEERERELELENFILQEL